MMSTTKTAGFTLLELMVVIAIISVLAGITTPGFIHWQREYRTTQTANEIRAAFQSAKCAAAKHNKQAVVAFVESEKQYAGYIVFFDTEIVNGTPDTNEPIITQKEIPRGVECVRASFGGGRPRVAIKPIGIPGNDGSVIVKSVYGESYRKIILSRAGNIRMKKGGVEILNL